MNLRSILMMIVIIANISLDSAIDAYNVGLKEMPELSDSAIDAYNVELKEMPELSYRISDLRELQWSTGYVYYKDILIVIDNIYEKQGAEYKKIRKVADLIGLDESQTVDYAQYKNLLILEKETKFYIYDMDTWMYELIETDCYHVGGWIVYHGQLLYLNDKRNLCQYNLINGEKRELKILNNDRENVFLSEFRIRDGGKMIIGKYDQERSYEEFWLLKMNENGVLEEEKIWETSEWKYSYWLDYNQYGLVVYGQFYYVKDNPSGGPGTMDELVVIKENGEVERLNFDVMGEYCLLDNGYLLSDITYEKEADDTLEEVWNGKHAVTSVSLYDYSGNKVGTYQLVDEELIEQGYFLEKLLYDSGVITGFYVQEGTDKLYISQVEIEG